jgi:TonB family protein
MTISAVLLTALLALGQGVGPAVADPGLDAVKRLYATAAYEDALARLTLLDGRADPNVLDQYRALCLLGLGRDADADQALERIVLRSPQFRLPENSASPGFLSRFASVRKRVLPVAVEKAYAKAKTTFDLKQYAAAADQFRELVTVLRAEAVSGDPALANLQQLAEGSLRLTEAELAAASREIYSALDFTVIPPVELERNIPPWNPPAQVSWRSFRGVVQVVVDERGNVESAKMAQSLADFYDAGLLEAAKSWRFTPAQRNGQPVKYRKLVEITMRPQ